MAPIKQAFKPDMLLDVKIPTNIALKAQDLDDRMNLMERYYGVVSDHNNLGNLKTDGHSQYALAASASDRNAVAYLFNGKNRVSIGSGVPHRPQGINPTKGDQYHRTDTPTVANQRLYCCTVGGPSPTWVGIL